MGHLWLIEPPLNSVEVIERILHQRFEVFDLRPIKYLANAGPGSTQRKIVKALFDPQPAKMIVLSHEQLLFLCRWFEARGFIQILAFHKAAYHKDATQPTDPVSWPSAVLYERRGHLATDRGLNLATATESILRELKLQNSRFERSQPTPGSRRLPENYHAWLKRIPGPIVEQPVDVNVKHEDCGKEMQEPEKHSGTGGFRKSSLLEVYKEARDGGRARRTEPCMVADKKAALEDEFQTISLTDESDAKDEDWVFI